MPDCSLRILLVEDNDDLRLATLAYLQKHGHDARGIAMAEEISDVLGGFMPDIYVIDLNLPEEDGISLTRRLRQMHRDVGIVITTARTQFGDKIIGYESGADLYLTKPVHPGELLAGISSLAKRLNAVSPHPGQALIFDPITLCLSGNAGSVDLTAAESQLLVSFVRAPGKTLERWQIGEITGAGIESTTSASIEMRVTRLRKKLAAAGAENPTIKALHKVGYKLCYSVVFQSKQQ